MAKSKINLITKAKVVIVIKSGCAEVYSNVPMEAMVVDRDCEGADKPEDLTKFHVKRKQVNGEHGAINDRYEAYASIQDTDEDPAIIDQFWKQSKLAG